MVVSRRQVNYMIIMELIQRELVGLSIFRWREVLDLQVRLGRLLIKRGIYKSRS